MYAHGFNWWMTKHGRKRFLERFGQKPDAEILEIAIAGAPGYEFIWAPDKTYPLTGRRLITVLKRKT